MEATGRYIATKHKENFLTEFKGHKDGTGCVEGSVPALSEQHFDGHVYKGLKQGLIFPHPLLCRGLREAVCQKRAC